eukprot:2715862-Pleurochrysis_carterae.AAC.1
MSETQLKTLTKTLAKTLSRTSLTQEPCNSHVMLSDSRGRPTRVTEHRPPTRVTERAAHASH